MSPLRILILSDGRPGHFNLSEGIAAAIGRLRPTTVTRIAVRRGRWPGPVLAALTRLPPLPPGHLLAATYGIDVDALPAIDIVISAGAETLAANIWVARARAVPNLFYGSLRQYRPTDFSLVLTSYRRNAGRPRHMLALKPSALDPDQLTDSREHKQSDPSQPPTRAALLLGGDAGTFSYTDTDWDRLLGFLPAAHAAFGTTWLVSNSRRTPTHVSDRVADLARAAKGGIERFVDVRTAGAGPLAEILGAVDAVVCTDDSSSMISECIWAQLPVIGVTPVKYHHTPDEGEYRRWLADQGWCRSMAIADLSAATFLANLGSIAPLQVNPLDELADRIVAAVPQLGSRA